MAMGMTGGCGSALQGRSPGGASIDRWVQRFGGVDEGAAARVRQACQPVLRWVKDQPGFKGQPVSLFVLASDFPSAYAWPHGEIFVTRGLAALLTDNELAAAVAHELGHLIDGGQDEGVGLGGLRRGAWGFWGRTTPKPQTLDGDEQWVDIECRADAAGVKILTDAGLAPTAMTSMLKKLREAHRTRSTPGSGGGDSEGTSGGASGGTSGGAFERRIRLVEAAVKQ